MSHYAHIVAAIRKHIPAATEAEASVDAALLLLAAAGLGSVSEWNPAAEREKLADMARAASALAAHLTHLHPYVRAALFQAVSRVDTSALRQPYRRGEGYPLGAVLDLPAVLQAVMPEAERACAQSKGAGRTNWRAVAVVGAARECWHRRTGHAAPARAFNAATRFGCFLADVLAASGVRASARPAFAAWCRTNVQSWGKETP